MKQLLRAMNFPIMMWALLKEGFTGHQRFEEDPLHKTGIYCKATSLC